MFDKVISIENLLLAWEEFIRGKRGKRDVQEFSLHLMDNILALHEDLKNKTYQHGGYHHFRISDPRPRDIHKALVRDRLLHHAIHRILYPFFNKKFIADSYSCRIGKGTHKAMKRFTQYARRVSQNNTRTCWVLKCDIRKFFANINHEILNQILCLGIVDTDTRWLLENIIKSFKYHSSCYRRNYDIGLPLGNLTSQLLVNIYMNEFDQFVKHTLKIKKYIRYSDDFVFFSNNRKELELLVAPVAQFLRDRLHLELHPDKLFLKTLSSGVDFLGWVHFSDHRTLRTSSKHRMINRLQVKRNKAVISSYRGLLTHGNAKKLQAKYLFELKGRQDLFFI